MLNTRKADVSTRLKVCLVGTRVGEGLDGVRWWAAARRRHRHPELWDMYLESGRLHKVFTQLVQPDWCCFDGGSHVGSVLALMVRGAPVGHHIAVEPVSNKVPLLRHRFPGVTVIEGALGATPGSMTFYDARSGYASFHPQGAQEREGREVQVITIDDCVDGGRLDLLKLDIEGAELWALQGARETIRREQPIIIFECGLDLVLAPFDYTRREMHSFLSVELGYSVYSIADYIYARDPLLPDEFVKLGVYPFRGFNYVAIPAGTVVNRMVPEHGPE